VWVIAFRNTFCSQAVNNFVAYCTVIWGKGREGKRDRREIQEEMRMEG